MKLTMFSMTFVSVLFLLGCQNSEIAEPNSIRLPDGTTLSDLDPNENLAIPDNSNKQQLKVLLFGNSHIFGIADILKKMVHAGAPGKTIESGQSKDIMYLQERLSDKKSYKLLFGASWTHVILQAQKYSQSGIRTYPTYAAETWISLAKKQSATPILYPEHPQRGNDTEGQRVYSLHKSISQRQKSCVAPIGPVWDSVIAQYPELVLHEKDGNHASRAGQFLTALIFYQVITTNSADLLPHIDDDSVSAPLQDALGQIVSDTLAQLPACEPSNND